MPIFFITDIEKSTEKWEKHRKEMGKVLARHDEILKEQIEKYEGKVIKHTGDGVFAVFEQGTPLHCALEIQRQFAREDWGVIGELRIRIGLHAGDAEKRGSDYFGSVVNRTARITAAGWSGQILLTPEVKDSCTLPSGAFIKDIGVHMLTDLGEPQQLYMFVHPDLELKEFPPIHSLSAHPHNLPSQTTPFIGREKELAELSKLLDDSACRLLNLVGPGGIGKTRLALQSAAEKIEKFHHGIYFIPFDSLTISSIQFLVFTIAEFLKFSFYSREDPKIQLLNYLQKKEMLLIMDNFEHLVGEAELLAEIFENAPKIKFLVTSRERLRLKGEWIIEIKGMKVPKHETIKHIADYSAVRLFLQSARRVKPDFVLSEKDKTFIIRICQLVEGLPLGIELASSWVRSLSCKEIAQEIEKNLDFLATTVRDMPKRHQSLKAVFDYSWNLLPKREHEVFRRLSVFQGGFKKEAAEKVAQAPLPMLSALVDKSLLRRNPVGRYEMLKVLRQYGEGKLDKEPQEKGEVQDQHCKYYADFLYQCEENFKKGKQRVILDAISEEIENVRAAWQWAVERNRKEEIGKSLQSLYLFYEMRGWLQEGEEVFRKTAEKLGKTHDPVKKELMFNKILARWGGFLRRLSLYEKARELFQKTMEIFRGLNAKGEISFCLNELGVIAYRLGEYTRGKQYHEENLAIKKQIGDQRGIAISYNNLGVITLALGDYDEAKRLHRKSLEIRKKINDLRGMAASMNNLGNVLLNLKEYTEAKMLYQESLAIRKEIGDRVGIASCLNNMGMIAEELGEHIEAKQLYEESLALKKEIGDQRGIGNTLDNLGSLSTKLGNYQESKKYYNEALKTLMEIRAIPLALQVILGITTLLIKEGKKESALVNCALVLHHPAGTKESKEKAACFFSELKTELPSDRVEGIRKNVETRKFEEVVKEILERLT